MSRVLRDEDGRELLLAEGCLVEENVLMVRGEPLVVLDDPQALSPSLMDAIADSLPGSRVAALPALAADREGVAAG